MTGRALVFADAEIIKLASTRFIPVAADDWYQRRRDDDEGKFFRHVADQGPRKGVGGSTRQGIYCFTADGKLLAYRNHHSPAVMRQELQKALREFEKLPEERRKPGAVKIPERSTLDRRFTRTLPAGGRVINVHARILDKKNGEYCKGTCESRPGGDFASLDHLWLTEKDCQSLIPASPEKGKTYPMPAHLVQRILRFHLADNTRGEPAYWTREQIRRGKITLTVTEVTDKQIQMRLDGEALLSTSENVEKSERGYDARMLGYLAYDREKKALTRFDVVVLGEHWGDSTFTRGARPGRTPLGLVLELADPRDPAYRVPPQASREWNAYLAGSR